MELLICRLVCVVVKIVLFYSVKLFSATFHCINYPSRIGLEGIIINYDRCNSVQFCKHISYRWTRLFISS